MTGTLLYDGDCAFCSTSVRLLRNWVPTDAEIVPWQRADLVSYGLSEADCADAVQWVSETTRHSGAAAFAALLRTSRPWWRVVGRLLGSRAGLLLADPVYRWVAANRYRLPGGTPACQLPDTDPPTA
jgi:predicted DCC family thiol-disulfide oxidoreductase YuxK